MSSMAYENLKDEKNKKRMEIDQQKFNHNFRNHPELDEVEKGYKNGPLFPQADISLKEIIERVREKSEFYTEWLVAGLGKR